MNQAMSLGALSLIPKPVDRDALLRTVLSSLRYHRLSHDCDAQQHYVRRIETALQRLHTLTINTTRSPHFAPKEELLDRIRERTVARVYRCQMLYIAQQRLLTQTRDRLTALREELKLSR